ncbi:hypothetical protein Y032_0144g2459 [Ancylostoma ceylanicum]|nr:hypothetical protein Y032_0144g2459 [Ancylostoma ceylanicum]
MVIAGLKLFARFYLILLQGVMTTNRFCAIVFVAEYEKLFTMRKTILIVTVLFIVTLPTFPFYAFEIGECLYVFRPNYLVWTYSLSVCRDIHEISLITVNCVVLSFVILADIIVLVLLWKRRENRMLQSLDSFWSELQFIIMTVILGILTAISIGLRTALDRVPIEHVSVNYVQKVVDVILSLVSIIAVGFINRKVRMEILKIMRPWEKPRTQKRNSVLVQGKVAGNF